MIPKCSNKSLEDLYIVGKCFKDLSNYIKCNDSVNARHMLNKLKFLLKYNLEIDVSNMEVKNEKKQDLCRL